MQGRVIKINNENRYGRIDTQNKEIGLLTFYLSNIKFNVNVDDTVSFDIQKSQAGNDYAVNVCLVQRNTSKFNTEDKQVWCKEGEKLEIAFVANVVPKLNIDIRINPDKKNNPCVIDLFDYTNKKYADLKSQNTPFFTAGKYTYVGSGNPYDPTYTVTFNKKDYENYRINYPDSDIYWCINWTQLDYRNIKVEPLNGVWRAKFSDMAKKIEQNQVKLHSYMHRVNDDVNAKESYLFDLRDTTVFEKLV